MKTLDKITKQSDDQPFNGQIFEQDELLQEEKEVLLRSSLYKGYLSKRDNFKNWTRYYAIFSGSYLYLYLSHTNLVRHSYLVIKKDAYAEQCDQEIGVVFSFKLVNNAELVYFKCDAQNSLR